MSNLRNSHVAVSNIGVKGHSSPCVISIFHGEKLLGWWIIVWQVPFHMALPRTNCQRS